MKPYFYVVSLQVPLTCKNSFIISHLFRHLSRRDETCGQIQLYNAIYWWKDITALLLFFFLKLKSHFNIFLRINIFLSSISFVYFILQSGLVPPAYRLWLGSFAQTCQVLEKFHKPASWRLMERCWHLVVSRGVTRKRRRLHCNCGLDNHCPLCCWSFWKFSLSD